VKFSITAKLKVTLSAIPGFDLLWAFVDQKVYRVFPTTQNLFCTPICFSKLVALFQAKAKVFTE
jgi:hypothetical protein